LAFSWTDKPWFLTEEKFATVLIIPSSWGSQLGGYLPASQSSEEEKLIFALSQGAEHCLIDDINGYIFYTEEKDSNCDY
jgi:hypothetical protein